MVLLIVAQAARVALVWTTGKVAKKIIKTVIVTAVGGYLIQRHKKITEREERRKF
jgi:hypothetical protein